MSEANMFKEYLKGREMKAQWERLPPHYADNSDPNDRLILTPSQTPSPRGGHAMCIDFCASKIYLLGGYTGTHTLSDFWIYDITLNEWMVLSDDTEKEKNGPGKRCCHKMVWDEKSGCIYLLGRLGEGVDVGGCTGVTNRNASEEESESEGGMSQGNGQEPAGSKAVAYCSEFHRYHTRGLDAGKWDLLSFDTAVSYYYPF